MKKVTLVNAPIQWDIMKSPITWEINLFDAKGVKVNSEFESYTDVKGRNNLFATLEQKYNCKITSVMTEKDYRKLPIYKVGRIVRHALTVNYMGDITSDELVLMCGKTVLSTLPVTDKNRDQAVTALITLAAAQGITVTGMSHKIDYKSAKIAR